MAAPWIVLAAIVGIGVLYVLVPVAGAVFVRFRAPQRLMCPETGTAATVGAAAGWAAVTALFRHPILRVKRCSLWPGRSGCQEGCLRD